VTKALTRPANALGGAPSERPSALSERRGTASGAAVLAGDGVTSAALPDRASAGTPLARKECARCGWFKAAEDFRPNPHLRSGLNSWCRECCREANRRWRAENREAYNLARRVKPSRLVCGVCGGEFYGRRDRKTCSAECQKLHKRRLDKRCTSGAISKGRRGDPKAAP
jgi:hypothetical protein